MWRLVAKIAYFFRRGSAEKDLDREVTAHLTLLADEFQSRGMTQQEAWLAAKRSFGSVAQVKQSAREERSLLWLEQTWQDVRYACRNLFHSPGFTFVAVLTLALGMGVDTTFFTTFNALALKPLPLAEPNQVVRFERWFKNRFVGNIQYQFSYSEYTHIRDHNDVFSGVAAASWPVGVVAEIRGGALERLQGELVSSNYFGDLGVGASLGRVLLGDEDPVVVLSNSFWQRRFNGDAGVLGQVMVINGVAMTIAGVAPEVFNGTSVALQVPDFWAPLAIQKRLIPGQDWAHDPSKTELQLLARLKPSVPMQQAQAQADTPIRQFSEGLNQPDPTTAVTLQHTSFLGNTEDVRFKATVAGLMLLVGLVLLTACVNIANMLLARGAGRQREIGVRLALGASRGRIIRQLITESLLLSFAGCIAGLLISVWASKLLWIVVQQMLAGPLTGQLAIRIDLSPDVRVFSYAALLAVATGILFGLAPALRFTRPDLASALKGEGTGFGRRFSRSWLRGTLVGAQVTVSTMLLISAGLLMRGMIRSRAAGTGFETKRVFLVSTDFGDTPAKAAQVERSMMDRLQTLPEVKSVGLGRAPLVSTWTPPILVVGPHGPMTGRTLASYASNSFLETLDIPLLRGRSFSRREAEKGDPVAVISESTARRYWPQEDPLGKRLMLDLNFRGIYTEFEVVGIAKDVRFANLTRIDPAHVYLATNAAEPYPMLLRVQGNSQEAVSTVRSTVAAFDRTLLPGLSVVSLEEGPLRLHRSLTQTLSLLGGILALLALSLASVGIYGVMAFLVSQRKKEIGVRIAMGATPGDVLNAVVIQGLRPVFLGIVLGVAGAGALSFALHASLSFPGSTDLLYGVPFYDPATFLGLSLFLVIVAACATLLPAQRALRIDPVVTLRYE